jgi:hypothetical protein
MKDEITKSEIEGDLGHECDKTDWLNFREWLKEIEMSIKKCDHVPYIG